MLRSKRDVMKALYLHVSVQEHDWPFLKDISACAAFNTHLVRSPLAAR